MAEVITKHAPDITVTAETSGSSAENAALIAKHEVELAIVQNDIAFYAAQGESSHIEPASNLRCIASLYPEHMQCVAAPGSGIKTFDGIKYKPVSVGALDSSTLDNVNHIFVAAGFKYGELDVKFLDLADSGELLRKGELAAAFILAGYPTAAVNTLAGRMPIDLATFDDGLLNTLIDKYPFFVKDVIPAGTYTGVNHDTSAPAVWTVLACDAGLSDELVYAVTKAIFENLEELGSKHEKAKLISLNKALDGAVVITHPGATKYYDEKNLIKYYTVTFDPVGGSSVPSQTVSSGGNVMRPPVNPTLAGFLLDGWYQDADYKAAWDFNTDVVTRDMTLYAKWAFEGDGSGDKRGGGGCFAFSYFSYFLWLGLGILALRDRR